MIDKEEKITCLDDRLLTTEEIKEKLKDVPEEVLEKFRKEAEEYKKRHGIED